MTPTQPGQTSQPKQAARFAAARAVLESAIASRAFPGCAYGVLAGGEILEVNSLGRFTYEPTSPAVTPETVYDIASVSKVVATTAMAMLLYQRGLLDLDLLLGDVLPGFVTGRQPGDHARTITLRHLLAHNSGLPGYVEFFRTARTPTELLSACLQLPLEAEPGTRFEYSDPGFILLGKALEVCSGENLASFMHREIFQPLAMTSTRYCPASGTHPSPADPLIPPTEEDTTFRHRLIQGEVQDENAWVLGGIAGHAGLFSNVPDLLRFSAGILDSKSEKVPSGKPRQTFRAGHRRTLRGAPGARGQLPRNRMGYALRKTPHPAFTFRRIP